MKINRLLILFALFAFINLPSINAQQNTDILYWTKDYRLMVSDFKGEPNISDTTSYNISSKDSTHKYGVISKSIEVKLTSANGKTTFKIYAGMQKNMSWIKSKTDTVTLKHEQGHFDICEIYARLLRKQIKNAKSVTEARQLYNNISEQENEEQDKYDRENKFNEGGITKVWSEKISLLLKELESYKSPVLTLSIY